MKRLLVGLTVSALVVAGCGESGEPAQQASPSASTPAPSEPPSGEPGGQPSVDESDDPSEDPADDEVPEVQGFAALPVPDRATEPPPTFVMGDDRGGLSVYATDGIRNLRQLATYDDPQDGEGDEGAFGTYIDTARYARGGDALVVSTCCEPAVGASDAIDFATGEREPYRNGIGFAFGGDGRAAYITMGTLRLEARDGTELTYPDGGTDGFSEFFSQPSWSVDGTRVVVVRDSEEAGTSELLVLDVADGSPEELMRLGADGPFSWTSPVFRHDGKVLVATSEQRGDEFVTTGGVVIDPATSEVVAEFTYAGDIYDQGYDRTHTYLLITFQEGRVRWRGNGQEMDLIPDGAVTAAWW